MFTERQQIAVDKIKKGVIVWDTLTEDRYYIHSNNGVVLFLRLRGLRLTGSPLVAFITFLDKNPGCLAFDRFATDREKAIFGFVMASESI